MTSGSSIIFYRTKPGRKLLYPAGILSLAILPLFLIAYLNKYIVFFESTYAMEVVYWSDRTFDDQLPFSVHPKRKFIDINITGNDTTDKIKLDFAQIEIRDLVLTKDTTKGIHFHFDATSRYKAFVQVLNIILKEKQQYYTAYHDDIWIYHFIPQSKSKIDYSPVCGGIFWFNDANLISTIEDNPPWKEAMINFMNEAKFYMISGLLFFVMVVTTVIKLRKQIMSRRIATPT